LQLVSNLYIHLLDALLQLIEHGVQLNTTEQRGIQMVRTTPDC